MDSSNYSQTYNIQDIIDKIEEETNLTVPSAVIIPLKQHRTVNLNANDTFEIDVKLMTRKRIFKKISIQPAEIENPNLVYKFGTKGVSRLSEDEWDICKKIYHKLSENIDEECVYGFVGEFDNKYIFIKISAYHKMTVVHIENSCGKVKWKKRMPVSDKGKGRGIGLLNVKQSIDKYDGDLQLKQDGNRFVADLFLNS